MSMDISKKIIAILTAFVIICVTIFPMVGAYAADGREAVVKVETVNVRKGAGLTYDVKTKLSQGKQLTIIKEEDIADGYIWYKVSYTKNGETKKGWVRSDCITIISTSSTDVDFETYLKKQGFPESYKTRLRVLHEQYPKWVFQAQHTNLEWKDVIAAETKLGLNLIQNSAISSWKSTQTGAYNWETGTWIEFDSGNWVMASEALIAHYMDPRNMLDETNVFQFLGQSYDATIQTAEGLDNVVKNTFLAGKYEENGKKIKYTNKLMKAAEKSGVSPYTLASMIIMEQGANGTGNSISGVVKGYEGYYNFFNIGAYKTANRTAVQQGLWYAQGSGKGDTSYNRPWNTRARSIIGGAMYYGEGYVAAGQDTFYLKKFNVQGDSPYTHQYMTNVQGASGEAVRLARAFNETARDTALIFKIPVYKNMPAQPPARPTGEGSPNNMLKSLSITGQSLSPTFDMYTTSYSLIVGNEVNSVEIVAKAVDSGAVITGAGTVTLKVGTNVCDIKVKAVNGAMRTYRITIVRERAEGDAEPVVTTKTYKMDEKSENISGITEFPIKAGKFAKQFAVTDGRIQITDADGKEVTGNVGTGCQVRVYDNNDKLTATYQVVLYGDTNGDGMVNALDLLRVQKNILGMSMLKGLYQKAADTGRNGKIDALDLLQVQKQIIGKGKINQ